jgi:hypothetical protein
MADEEDRDPFLEIEGQPDAVLDDDRRHVFEQLQAKRWDDLGVLERGGRLLFPEKIWRRDKETGEFVGDACFLVLPKGSDLRKARTDAIQLAKDAGIDREKDADLFGDLEILCILWRAIREPIAPEGEDDFPAPLTFDALALEKKYERVALMHVNDRLNHLKRVVDPKVGRLSAPELEALTAALVSRQHLSPLFALDAATQTSFILTMALLHQSYLRARSSLGSSAPSTSDSSPSPS